MARNEKLRQKRLQKHWTLEGASEAVGVHITTYNSWELGLRKPHLTTLRMLCTAFDASAEELGFEDFAQAKQIKIDMSVSLDPIFLEQDAMRAVVLSYDVLEVAVLSRTLTWKSQEGPYNELQIGIWQEIRRFDTMLQPQQDKEVQISRRQALRTIAKLPIGMLGLMMLGSSGTYAVEDMLPVYATGLIACRAMYRDGGIEAVSSILSNYLSTLTALAQQPSMHQKAAASLVGQAYLLMTLVADHRGDLNRMEHYCLEAQKYAHLASDPNLEAASLLRLAVKFDYESRWRKTLQTYQVVQPLSSQISPLLRSRLYLGLAGAHAYCHEKEDAQRMLDLASEMFPQKPEDDPCFHYAFTNHDTLSLWTGLTQKYTGQYEKAWDTFTRIGQLQPVLGLPEWNRIEFVKDAASVAIWQRDLEKSTAYLEEAGTVALASRHEQRYAETCDTYRQMQVVWPNEPKVRALQDLFSER